MSKKIFKTAAVLLGYTSCIAQGTKCPQQADQLSAATTTEAEQITETITANNPHALARFQDLDKLYYL